MSQVSKLFKPPFQLIGLNHKQPKGEFFMRIVNTDGADLKGKDLRELINRANSQPDLLKALKNLLEVDYMRDEFHDEGRAAIAKAKQGGE
jgi:hypothetical protein